MSFTTLNFIAFLAVFLAAYYLLPSKFQNLVLLVGNYIFYMLGSVWSGLLLFVATLVSFLTARAIQAQWLGKKRLWVVLGAGYILGQLLLLKYLGFFFNGIAAITGLEAPTFSNLFLPIGISFFTFSISGYLFDVYAGRLKAHASFTEYAAFISFFPAILSGPVGKARAFLPQMQQAHTWSTESVKAGLLRFVTGCAKKMVLADFLGMLVDTAYTSPADFTGGIWLFAAIAYSFQIYFDFSSYSDMALGIAQMLGFQLTENFDHPYCSTSVKSFWKKWHISLTSWFREYLYFPLGGSRVARWRCYLNILIVFAVSGLWHGASTHFFIWGLLNGLYQVVGEITAPVRRTIRRTLRIPEESRLYLIWRTVFTFALITTTWVFFRSAATGEAVFILKRIALILRDGFGTQSILVLGQNLRSLRVLAILFVGFGILDVLQAFQVRVPKLEKTRVAYWLTIFFLLMLISLFGVYGEGYNPQDFVYFKF